MGDLINFFGVFEILVYLKLSIKWELNLLVLVVPNKLLMNHFNYCRKKNSRNLTVSTEEELTTDDDTTRYCVCNDVAYGTMVACDNKMVIL